MTKNRQSLKGLGVTAVLAIVLVGISPANAERNHMEKAMSALKEAKHHLEKADANKGGHRLKAIDHVDKAMNQVELGISYAENGGSRHGGMGSSNTPGSLRDLLGSSARHVGDKMRQRGYRKRDSWVDGDHKYGAWEEQENGNCVRVGVSNGRIAIIENTSRSECRQ